MLFAGAAGGLLRTADAGQQRQQLGGKAKYGGGQQPTQAKIIQRQGLHQRQLHTAGVQGAQHAGQQCAQRSAPALSAGSAGLVQATQMVNSYFDPAVKLIYAAGALCGLIGAIRVYSKFSSGDPDTGKTAGSWFGACVFLIVAATVLRSFFL